MKSWLSLLEMADVLAKQMPRVAALSRKRRRETVLRLVRRVERIEGNRISKRVGREWFVNVTAVDALRKWDPDSLHELARSVRDLHQKSDDDRRKINAHGSKLREHDTRLGILEEKQKIAEVYLNAMAAIDRRNTAA